ncbi:MAG: hypothetical protein HY898_14060 [Deltaproteobacteria bacterium]|nr:hypothetical protein [Deltaproteobacteria bacterium]
MLVSIVREGNESELTTDQITFEVATAMYDQAVSHGAGESDIGLFGPRMYRRDARVFVEGELARMKH